MNVWLVNPFDPLPGEEEQLGRYARLAQALAAAGHQVTWWSSDFSHRFKRKIDVEKTSRAAREMNITLYALPTTPYISNVSLRRLWSHRQLASTFAKAIQSLDAPDLILASSPPLELANAAVTYGNEHNILTVVDIQDQWPDNFARLFPRALRWSAPIVLQSLYRIEQECYTNATDLIGVARAYVDHGLSIGGPKQHTGVFPLGIDLADFDTVVQSRAEQKSDKWRKPPGQLWFIYSGSLSHNYDVMTILRAAEHCASEFGQRVQFFISGTGDLANTISAYVAQHNLTNVKLLGFLPFAEWAHLITQCDVGFNAVLPDALIYLPNKIFYYFAAGLAILNTIPGQCSDIVRSNNCGIDYVAGDEQDCLRAIHLLINSKDKLQQMKKASRKLAEAQFDRAKISQQIVTFLEQVQSGACSEAR